MIWEKPNGKLWICLDPKGLNTAIIDDPHPIPTLDDKTHKLNGSTLYGKLYEDSGHWNVKLTKESSMLTTFNSNTRLGKYKFERLPFGVKTSHNTFQRKADETYYACRDVVGISDDILLYGTESNFDVHLHEVMEVTRQAGIKLNYDKCIIKTKSSSFGKCLHSSKCETRSREGGSHKEDGSSYQQATVAECPRYGDLFRSIC